MNQWHMMVAFAWVMLLGAAARAEKAPAADPAKVDADYAIQGEYAGEMLGDQGKTVKVGARVIALGEGKFHAVGFVGGLPGEEGWIPPEKLPEADGQMKDGAAVFAAEQATVTIKDGALTVVNLDGQEVAKLKKVERKSPTLDAKPPEGAMVLFDGKNVDQWKGGRMTEEGLLMEGAETNRNFKDCSLHLEFRIPYEPKNRGQGRGNSGCYMMGRYETQILDSFGLPPKDNECGGIYTVSVPKVPMSFPPLTWQTYDIDFTAPMFDADGKKTRNATLTVKHNGVLIHDRVQVPGPTTAAPYKESPDAGPIYLQNHGNPVRFRNIWVVEKK
ncbi:MAG: DUF1080 domain-containing protein [Planctomycetota bacterium]|nr:DUF1080 domain-containing protein [Planctomycetota bacterium]